MRFERLMCGGSVIALAGALAVGCSSGSSRGGGVPLPTTTTSAAVAEAQTREVLEATTLVTESSTLPFLVAMDELSPGNFPTTGSSASTTTVVNGGTTSGTATFDFSGSSSSTTGSISVDYNGTAGAATIVMTFANFGVTTTTSNLAVNGALTYVAAYSGSNATVTASGSLTVVVDGVTSTIAINTTLDYDGVQQRSVIAGTTTITHSQHGTWTTTLAGVTSGQDSNGDVVVTAGTATLTRTLPFPATAVYVFSGNNAGTFTVSPSGITGSFQL